MSYTIRESDFHGGREISKHRSLKAAILKQERLARAHRKSGCRCGGCFVFDGNGEGIGRYSDEREIRNNRTHEVVGKI